MISGLLYQIFPTETYRDFRSRKLWVQEMNVKYPNMWELILSHDGCDDLDNFKEGDIVDCDYRIIGRIYEDRSKERRVKTTIQCIEIRKI